MTTAQVDAAIRDEYRVLVGVARRMLGPQADAEDVVQNALVSYLADPRRAEPSRALLVWLVRKRCLDELRAQRLRGQRQVAALDEEAIRAACSAEPLHAVLTREDLSELAEDVERLPAPQRRALMLTAQGTPHESVAGELGLSVSASRALVARARDNLRLTRLARATPCAEIRERGAAASAAGVRAPEVVRRHLWTCGACRAQLTASRQVARRLRQRVAALVPGPAFAKLAAVAAVVGAGAGVAAVHPWEGAPAPAPVQRTADALRDVNARMPPAARAELPSARMVEMSRNGALRVYAQRSAHGSWCIANESGAEIGCVSARYPDPIWLSISGDGRVDGRVRARGAVRVALRVDGHAVTAPVGRAGFFTARARGVARLRTIPRVEAVARDRAGRVVARWAPPAPHAG